VWTSTLFGVPVPPPKAGTAKPVVFAMSRQKTVNEDLKKELLKVLLEVYMSDGYVIILLYTELRTDGMVMSQGSECRTRSPFA
jgi:hypothetical protein